MKEKMEMKIKPGHISIWKRKTKTQKEQRFVRDVSSSGRAGCHNGFWIARFQYAKRRLWIDLFIQRYQCDQKWCIGCATKRSLPVHHLVSFILANLCIRRCGISIKTTSFDYVNVSTYLKRLMTSLLLWHCIFLLFCYCFHRSLA